ncbi:DNase I-like protein [Polychaeton citri CBS 116435]|uniref:DNase I-like protein n=1 Tax=Polychaeton citri CBS 116435 TaxID=1314669 RepID=A0A9P4Q3P1_9PEZI|nr:DNase I-like protein [Polychaeton citri CBS 116435]
MMAQDDDGTDITSIKPVSSLRSRFENLGKDQDTVPSSPVGQRSFSAGFPGTSPSTRPRTSTAVGNDGGVRPFSATPPVDIRTPVPRKPRPEALQSRPMSMVTPASPPLVTIDSPHSPAKGASVPSSSPAAALTPDSATDSPTRSHARTLSRITTPNLEARMSPFVQASAASPSPSNGVVPRLSLLDSKPVSTKSGSSVPPPVNRAAKPKVPVKPIHISKPREEASLSAPDQNAELSDQSISPFNTPPGSESSSPPKEHPSTVHQRPRNESDASFVERLRGDSDASTHDRPRGNSSASFRGRFRADSNASWVERVRGDSNASSNEPSSVPDNHFQPPPVHHHVATRREQQIHGLSRTPTMPARFRPVHIDDRNYAGDLPDERPRLPTRPDLQNRSGRASPSKSRSGRTSPTKARSGRTSPVKALHQMTIARSSLDSQRPSMKDLNGNSSHRIPASRPTVRSALTQGFDRYSSPTSTLHPPAQTVLQNGAPVIPAPRRSMETRRKPPSPPRTADSRATAPPRAVESSLDDHEDVELPSFGTGNATSLSDFPDASQTNRRPPRYKARPYQIPTEYDTKLLATCGEVAITTGYVTKAWNLRTGESLLNMAHGEGVKCTSLVFKPSLQIEDEGKRVWLGTSIGEIIEVDIPSKSVIKSKTGMHARREIIRMYRNASQLCTLDESGDLSVWLPDHKGMPSLDSQYNKFRVPKGHTYSIMTQGELWIATGKELRVFRPHASTDSEFQVLRQPLSQPNTSDITSGTTISSQPDLIYFGHSDGKVSIYNRRDYTCINVVNVSLYKISSLAGVGDNLWAGYGTGMAYVYDMSVTPWKVKKDWQAHEKQICAIVADHSAMWKMDRLHVLTLGTDNIIRIWDGLLEEDWLEAQMHTHDSEYCNFEEMTAAVLTWNAGASKPSHLQNTKQDSNFFREYLTSGSPPDIFVFGFQELVDLENKKVTAKSLFKSKKREPDEQQHMSHQYRAWRDHLSVCLDESLPRGEGYTLINTASLVGLFTCVFVKSSLKSRIQYMHTAEVKRGMGGLHGNKGALILRLVLDDSSICLINCHLAAGQTQTIHRNNDIAGILESDALPAYPLNQQNVAHHSDVFSGGGDGSMILDHEICILNGDLNYRIDTMGRDTVVKHAMKGDLDRLLDRDQLLLSRKRNPGFRLRAFRESPITFAPTYKYNVQSDEYDTSEKKRAPAWCDRILYRGFGRVKMEEYRRWEVRVSDHRPVSGRLKFRVKKVDAQRREAVWEKCVREFDEARDRTARAVQLDYLTNTFGLTAREAAASLQQTTQR